MSAGTSRSHHSSHLRWTIAGWLLLGVYVAIVARSGGIANHVRLFQIGYAVGFIGYAMLVTTLWRCGPTGRWAIWLVGCFALRVALLWTAPSDDLHRYVWEGRVQLAGYNPYTITPDDDALTHLRDSSWALLNHKDYPAIYPPLAQLECRVVAWAWPTVQAIKTVHVAFDFAAVVVLGMWLAQIGRPAHWAILYGLCPLTLTAFGVEGHIDSLMLFCLCAAGLANARGRRFTCATFIAAGILAKLIPIVVLPWLAWRDRRAAVVCVLVVMAGYLPYLDAGTGLFTSLTRFAGDTAMLGLGHDILSVWMGGVWARRVGGCVIGVTCLLLARRRTDPATYMLGAMGVVVVFMPIVHYWYVTWILMTLPFVPRASWLVLAAAMVFYFDAFGQQATTGQWRILPWVAMWIYGPFVVAWFAELFIVRRRFVRDAAIKRDT